MNNTTCLCNDSLVENVPPSTSTSIQSTINGVIGLCTVILNLITITSIVISKCMLKKQKVCLLTIISSDTVLGFQVFCLALIPITYENSDWLCHLRIYATVTCTIATLLSNLMVTLERFVCVVLPLNYERLVNWEKLLVCSSVIWALSIFLSYALFYEGFSGNTECRFLLVGNPRGYAMTGFIICIIVLVDVSLYMYILNITRKHIRRIAATMVGGDTPYNRATYIIRKEVRLTFTVGIILLALAVSYLPMGAYIIYYGFFPDNNHSRNMFTTLVTLYMTNSVVNPLLYIWRLKSCRHEIIERILGCLKFRDQH